MERPLILKEKDNFNRIDGYDWSLLQEKYADNSIDKIIDKAGAGIKRRVTSYPTPLARMHFFEDAFQYVVDANQLNDSTIFHEAVSHCLDVWEILFNYEVFKENLGIKKWNYEAINELKKSDDNGHRILGKSLDLFMKQDKTIQLEDTVDGIYLLTYNGNLFAGSSPFTGFFTIDFDKDNDGNVLLPYKIKVPGSAGLAYFESIRSIDQRDEEFQEYMFRLIKTQKDIEKYFTFFYKYIDKHVKPTEEIKRIRAIGNPEHVLLEYNALISEVEFGEKKIEIPAYDDIEVKGEKLSLLNKKEFRGNIEITFTGKKHHLERQVGIQMKKRKIKIANNCDFIIDTKNKELRDKKVLALRQTPDDKAKKYIGSYWDDDIKVAHYNEIKNWERDRKIPSWNIEHPYLVMNDLLEEYLIELPYNINTRAFITCSMENSQYLLPIKPLYFKFFTITDLEKNLVIKKTGKGNNQKIVATLAIPLINNNKITFSRIYEKSIDFRSYDDIHSSVEGKGHIVEYSLGLMLFPFLKTEKKEFNDFYKVACIDGNFGIDKESELHFFDQENIEPIEHSDARLKVEQRVEKLYQRKTIAGSKYYQLTGKSFDYIQAEIPIEEQSDTIKGLIIPTWNKVIQPIHGTEFTFAVDFGTTNSHVAYKAGGIKAEIDPKPFTINEGNMQIERLDMATAKSHVSQTEKYDYKNPSSDEFIDFIIRKQRNEFIPSIIGEVYKAPFRTAMSQTTTKSVSKGNFDLFGNINIAFALNKRFEEDPTWKVHTNLKWSSELDNQERVEFFIKELLYMIRTKVILEQGDPKKTKIYWFTPLNMAPPIYQNLSNTWTKYFKEIFKTDQQAISISESEAPFYDKKSSFGNAEVLSIDIGGMTTDVLYIKSKQPIFGSSFSFAGNALYGDFPATGTSKGNGFIKAFAEQIRRNIEAARDNSIDEYKKNRYSEALGAYKWYFEQDVMNSEDIISFFYSDDEFRFAEILKNSYDFKIVFLLHYAGIIYHCAQLIKDSDNECPGDIYFSGNGSLMFKIIDTPDHALLGRIAQKIFDRVLGDSTEISIHLSDKPKEASCNGALKSGLSQSQKPSKELKYIFLGENINWGENPPSVPNKATYEEIQKVRKNFKPKESEYYKFIDLFFELYEDPKFDFETNFGIQLDVNKLKVILKNDKDTADYHYKGTNWQMSKGSKIDASITETVFFYPLMGGINKLLNELANKKKGAASIL